MNFNSQLRISSIILYLVSLIIIGFGLTYLLSNKIMPYHETYLGLAHEQLNAKTGYLFLTLMKVAGSCFLAVGFTLIILISFPFKRRNLWAWWSILSMTMIALVPLLIITLNIGVYTPWWVVAILIVLILFSLFFSRSQFKN